MRRVLLLLGLASLLTACGGGTKSTSPQALPPVSAPASPSTAASAGATPMSTSETSPSSPDLPTAAPGLAEPKEAETATDFARSWLGAIDRAYAAVDNRELQRLGDPACQTCNNVIRSVKRAQSLRLHYRGGETSILDLAAPPDEQDKTAVTAVLAYAAAEEVDASGKVVRALPAVPKLTLQIELKKLGRGWIVMEAYKA